MREAIQLRWLTASALAIVMVVSLVGCGWQLDRDKDKEPVIETEESQVTLSKHMTEHQKDRFQMFVARVVRDRNNLTPETIRQFWELVDEVKATDEEVATMKDLLAGPIVLYMKFFFDDALIALSQGIPYKSPEREQYEQHLKSLQAITDERIQQNDELMAQIASREPILKGGEAIDELIIRDALMNVNEAINSITILFTRPE
ncbi:hypothetical protein [Paenibacillus sp. OV219]|uniref:hypothetical protein n=1 Tax=Paenibacillus sp. OV219 TaxID=1884377 RepID=UPI0008CEE1A9|nr:hypothetical protein [Paenibacillus sp. OV219]SEO05907.1 hypothetical protein SAMN05518847_105377 [Paenibacillus sp. OV219]